MVGVYPMILATVYTVVIAILVSAPVGILAAIYLQKYAKQGRLVSAIRFCTESLAGIPFNNIRIIWWYILRNIHENGILIIIRIFNSCDNNSSSNNKNYRRGFKKQYLRATEKHHLHLELKLQTLYKVIVPSAMPGIISGVILSIGRVVGESAAILLTAGTVAKMPAGIMSSARTLTVHSYLLTKRNW